MAENEIFKSGKMSVDVAPRTVGILKTSIQFSTQDQGTAKLIFSLSKDGLPLPLSSAATAKIFLRMADGSVFEKTVSIVDQINGKLEYVLEEEVSHPGLAKGELNINYANGQALSVCKFSFNIDASLMDQDIVPLAEYYVKGFNTLQSDIEQRAAVINETVDEMKLKVDEFESTAVTLDPRLTTVEEKVATATVQLADTVNSKVEVVNIKEQFGAVAGAADNTQSFLNAATYAKANGMALYLPKGNYTCASDVIIDGIKHIILDGTVSLATGKVLDISYDSYIAPCNWKITNVAGGLLRISGLNSSKIEIIKAKELELYAHGDIPKKEFMAYNTFTLGKIDTFRLFSEGVKDGWINENKFFGGRISNITFDGNFHHDNNIFYGTMLEGFTMTINRGISNFFYDVRMEGTNSITFGPGTSDNVIYRSWIENPNMYLRDTSGVTFTNNGFNNQVVSNLDIFHKKEVVYNVDSRSNNYPLSAFTRNQNDLTVESSGKVFYETDLIELNNPIGLVLKSDKSLFYISAYAYDANKVLLTTQQTNFIGMAGFAFYSGTGAYTFDTNVGISNTGVPLFPNGVVKYIKYRVRTGDGVTGQSFNYLKLIKIESNVSQTTMKVISPIKQWTHTAMPTKGYWEVTDEPVYNSVPTAGGKMGWKCLTTGTLNSLAWAATTAYTVGQKVNANGKVYEVTIAGTSGSTAPSHTTGTATDGTVTWKYLSALGLLKPFGVIDV